MEVKCKKVSYSSEKIALHDVKKYNIKSTRESKPIRTYLCPICFNWHLTSKPKKVDNLISELNQKIKNQKEVITQLDKKVLDLEYHIQRRNNIQGIWK